MNKILTILLLAAGTAWCASAPATQIDWRTRIKNQPVIDVTAAPYNAKGDGTTDDLAAINAAIAAAATGQTILFPVGTYKVTGTVSVAKGIYLQGVNRGNTYILSTATSGNIVSFDAGASTLTGGGLSDISIATSATNTNGWGVFVGSSGAGGWYDFRMDGVAMRKSGSGSLYGGLKVTVALYSHFSDIWINDVSYGGIWLRGVSASQPVTTLTLSDVWVSTGNRSHSSMFVGSYVAGVFHNVSLEGTTSASNYGHLQIADDAGLGATSYPKDLFFQNLVVDYAGNRGINIDAGRGISFINSWVASSQTNECIKINGGEEIRITASRVYACNTTGVWINGGANVWLTDSTIGGSVTDPAVAVSAGVSNFHIHNNTFTRDGSTTQHTYSIWVLSGASNNYSIVGNDLRGFSTAALRDDGSGTAKTISGNIPFSVANNPLSVPSCTQATLGSVAGSLCVCSDCAVASVSDNTCVGSGTGALAVLLNSVWRCFNAQN